MTEYKLGDQVLHRNEEFRTASGGPTMTVVGVYNQWLTLRDTDGEWRTRNASDVIKLPDLAKGDRVRVFGDTTHGRCGISSETMPFDTEVIRVPQQDPRECFDVRQVGRPEHSWSILPEMMTRLGPVETPPTETNLDALAPGKVYRALNSEHEFLLVTEMADRQWLTLRRKVEPDSGTYIPMVTTFEDGEEEFTLTPGDPEKFQRALVNLADVFNGQADAIRDLHAELAAVERWKEELTEDAHVIANEKDWCRDFDDFMENHGLKRRKHEYTVVVEARYSFTVDVSAESEEDAEDQAETLAADDMHNYVYPSEYDSLEAVSTEQR